MLLSVQGTFKDGKIELAEVPKDMEGVKVIVTFLSKPGPIDLAERGIGPEEAADLRWRFRTIAEDWERPEMDVYDKL